MPKFIYTAKNYEGESKGGEIVAKDEKDLVLQLRSEGFLLTSVRQIEEKNNRISVNFFDRFKTVPLKEKMVFARNLSVMISSGLPISRAIQNLSIQTENKTFKTILGEIQADLQSGKTLSEGMAKYPGVFNELFVNMVRVGETGGNLEDVLKIVAVQLEKEHDLISKVRGAMIYPAVIIFAMIGIGILMLTYILPQITGVFKDMGVTLPGPTRFIMAMSDALKNNSIAVAMGFILLLVGGKVFLSNPVGKRALSWTIIRLPVISNIVIKVNCARFARIYSSLLKSGISVTDALKIVSNTLSNYYYKQALNKGIEDIQKGVALSKILSADRRLFPPLVYQITEVGEETGKTETVLLQMAEFYEEEINQITKNMSSIIEPILMLVIGGAVGFFAVAMLQPMYSVLENIK
jgi:type IV pilus assembly protein PilC